VLRLKFVLAPQDVADEPEEVTHVAATYRAKSGAVIEFGFDKEVDRTQLFIPELIEDHNLDEDEFDPIKNALKLAFKVPCPSYSGTLS